MWGSRLGGRSRLGWCEAFGVHKSYVLKDAPFEFRVFQAER